MRGMGDLKKKILQAYFYHKKINMTIAEKTFMHVK